MSNDRIQQSHHHHHDHEPNKKPLSDDDRMKFNQELSDLIESFMVEKPSDAHDEQNDVPEFEKNSPPPHAHPLHPKPFYLFEQHKKQQERIESIKKTDPFGQASERNELD